MSLVFLRRVEKKKDRTRSELTFLLGSGSVPRVGLIVVLPCRPVPWSAMASGGSVVLAVAGAALTLKHVIFSPIHAYPLRTLPGKLYPIDAC